MLVPQNPIDVRAMHRRMTSGRPAGASAQQSAVVVITDEDASAPLGLRVAAKTEIWIRLHEHLEIHRTVRLMARDAAFP